MTETNNMPSRRLSKHVSQLTEWEKGYITGKLHGAKTLIQSPNFKRNVEEGKISGDIGVILRTVHEANISDRITEFSIADHPKAGKSRRVKIQLDPVVEYVGILAEPSTLYPNVVIDIDTHSLAVGYKTETDDIKEGPSPHHKDWVQVVRDGGSY